MVNSTDLIRFLLFIKMKNNREIEKRHTNSHTNWVSAGYTVEFHPLA